jgi:hypothetical protein
MSVIEAIEGSFSCNGICDYGVFYFSLPIKQGPPSKACKEDLKGLGNSTTYNIGIVMFVTFLLSYIGFFMQYCICYRRPEDL